MSIPSANAERTVVLHDSTNINNTLLGFYANANTSYYCYGVTSLEDKANKDTLFNLRSKGVRLRQITEITNENVSYNKTLKEVKGNRRREVFVSIKDTGQGIHPEIEPRLFSKFAAKSFHGTGLGLFISKSIVEAHGGKIWAENNSDGNGATFTFSLPITQEVLKN